MAQPAIYYILVTVPRHICWIVYCRSTKTQHAPSSWSSKACWMSSRFAANSFSCSSRSCSMASLNGADLGSWMGPWHKGMDLMYIYMYVLLWFPYWFIPHYVDIWGCSGLEFRDIWAYTIQGCLGLGLRDVRGWGFMHVYVCCKYIPLQLI